MTTTQVHLHYQMIISRDSENIVDNYTKYKQFWSQCPPNSGFISIVTYRGQVAIGLVLVEDLTLYDVLVKYFAPLGVHLSDTNRRRMQYFQKHS